MYREKLQQSHSSHSETVQALIKTMEARDYITEGHAVRLQDYAHKLATAVGLSEDRLTDLQLLARFHDLGKVGIPDSILHKPGPLTDAEFDEMRRHCEIGHRIALSLVDLAPVADFILKHHEQWDGQGYPLGLSGEDIPLECRILGIVDAYDAMTGERPYSRSKSAREALQELVRCAGTQFDPGLVKVFVSIMGWESLAQDGACAEAGQGSA
jgi:HD-GYP domain-containing protein (c-di-GMP phosphodiesterase class II)